MTPRLLFSEDTIIVVEALDHLGNENESSERLSHSYFPHPFPPFLISYCLHRQADMDHTESPNDVHHGLVPIRQATTEQSRFHFVEQSGSAKEPLARVPKAQHKKSRNGCQTCRSRRVKVSQPVSMLVCLAGCLTVLDHEWLKMLFVVRL